MEIDKIPLMSRDEILRRLSRMTGEPHRRRDNEITRKDMARWIGVDEREIRNHVARDYPRPISDSWQIIYSRFFYLVDTGCLVIRIQPVTRRKELVLVPKPEVPPKKPLRPRIEFGDRPSLQLE